MAYTITPMPSTAASPFNTQDIAALSEAQVRSLAQTLIERVMQDSQHITSIQSELRFRQARIDQLTHEIALLKHIRFAAKTEAMDQLQGKLFVEANAEDLALAEEKLKALTAPANTSTTPKKQPKRQPLPEHLPRIEISHEPQDTNCGCGQPMQRVSQDVSERLNYVPGKLEVHRHTRGIWACKCCEQLRQEPAAPQLIAGGIPTEDLLSHITIAKYVDHQPLYRQAVGFRRQGVDISETTLYGWMAQVGLALEPLVSALKQELLQSSVLHADETRLTILGPKGQTQRGYIWSYMSAQHQATQAVVFDVQASRSGSHAREFLRHFVAPPEPGQPSSTRAWTGHLMVDEYSGYKPLFTQGITELGCMAHARRKFFELHVANKSDMAHEALEQFGALYKIESDLRAQGADVREIEEYRKEHAQPRLEALHTWLQAQRAQVCDGTGSARALDYSLRRWPALIRYAQSGHLPIDNNRLENQIRPWALGRKNWLFAGSLAAAQRAGDIMSLVQTAQLNHIEPWAYLSDVLRRLPTHPNSRIHELLPTHWHA